MDDLVAITEKFNIGGTIFYILNSFYFDNKHNGRVKLEDMIMEGVDAERFIYLNEENPSVEFVSIYISYEQMLIIEYKMNELVYQMAYVLVQASTLRKILTWLIRYTAYVKVRQ